MLNEPIARQRTEKEGRFLQIFHLLPDDFFVTRADDSVVVEVNEAFQTRTGCKPIVSSGCPYCAEKRLRILKTGMEP